MNLLQNHHSEGPEGQVFGIQAPKSWGGAEGPDKLLSPIREQSKFTGGGWLN